MSQTNSPILQSSLPRSDRRCWVESFRSAFGRCFAIADMWIKLSSWSHRTIGVSWKTPSQTDARTRRSITTTFFDGLTYDELARQEGLPLGTVKTIIRRGLQRLRAGMEDDVRLSR